MWMRTSHRTERFTRSHWRQWKFSRSWFRKDWLRFVTQWFYLKYWVYKLMMIVVGTISRVSGNRYHALFRHFWLRINDVPMYIYAVHNVYIYCGCVFLWHRSPPIVFIWNATTPSVSIFDVNQCSHKKIMIEQSKIDVEGNTLFLLYN